MARDSIFTWLSVAWWAGLVRVVQLPMSPKKAAASVPGYRVELGQDWRRGPVVTHGSAYRVELARFMSGHDETQP